MRDGSVVVHVVVVVVVAAAAAVVVVVVRWLKLLWLHFWCLGFEEQHQNAKFQLTETLQMRSKHLETFWIASLATKRT